MNRLLSILYPAALLLVFSLFYFTELHAPVVIDYDEGVYAEVSRAMFERLEPIIPELNGDGFFEKPPMLYWAQMLGYELFGITPLGARFFNAAVALATLMVFYFGAAAPLGRRIAFHATMLLGSSIIFLYLARVAMTDMLLTFFLVSCLVVSWHGVERFLAHGSGASLFWCGCLAAGLAMLSKGVIGALFPIVTALIYLVSIGKPTLLFKRNWFIPGTLILVVTGFSWYMLLGLFHPDGFNFMKELFIEHHLGRFSSTMEGHGGPFFYYLIVLFFGFMPWFGYLLLGFLHLPLTTKGDPALRYLRLFTIFSLLVLLFFSAAATKLPNYILPALPGFALVATCFFERHPQSDQPAGAARPGRIFAAWLGAVPVGLLGIVCLGLPLLYPYLAEVLGEDAYKVPVLFEPVDLGFIPYLAGLLFLGSALLILRARTFGGTRQFEALLLSAFVNGCTLFFLIIPLYNRLMDEPLARLAEEAAILTPADGRIVMYEIDDRPSVNFVSGRLTVDHDERDWPELAGLFAQQEIEVGLTTAFYFERLQNLGLSPVELSRDGGFVLFRLTPSESPPPSP
ncbi:MAG: glycosyltransferase family 39 protein [Desulfofustis sp.]|nr:glycosyltransferase family 39 protein [Desulfofustis sp.]